MFAWLLALIRDDPGLWVSLLLVGVPIVVLIRSLTIRPRISLRIRLAVEFAVLSAMTVWSAWIWRPGFDLAQADRAERLAEISMSLAGKAKTVADREYLQNEVTWCARKVAQLRRERGGMA